MGLNINYNRLYNAPQSVEVWITGLTAQSDLENTLNWNVSGEYVGPTLSNTYQSQMHYDSNYLFIAVNDNDFIRILRA